MIVCMAKMFRVIYIFINTTFPPKNDKKSQILSSHSFQNPKYVILIILCQGIQTVCRIVMRLFSSGLSAAAANSLDKCVLVN